MKIARKLGITIAATVVSFGLIGISAPAHADTSWGCGGGCIHLPTAPAG